MSSDKNAPWLDGKMAGVRAVLKSEIIKKPEEIGVAASRGCIRMYNGDVINVYNLMMPGYSRVVVED